MVNKGMLLVLATLVGCGSNRPTLHKDSFEITTGQGVQGQGCNWERTQDGYTMQALYSNFCGYLLLNGSGVSLPADAVVQGIETDFDVVSDSTIQGDVAADVSDNLGYPGRGLTWSAGVGQSHIQLGGPTNLWGFRGWTAENMSSLTPALIVGQGGDEQKVTIQNMRVSVWSVY